MGAGRKTETVICSENPTGSHAAGASIVTYRKLSKNKLSGVIFGCTRSTIAECLSKKLFGLPMGHFCYVENISPGLPLFLFNYNDRKLHGIYEAASNGQLYLNSNAWTESGIGNKTPYPAQVSIRIRTQCQSLSEKQYKNIIEKNYYTPVHFWFELDNAQTNGLIATFKRSVTSTNTRTSPQDSSNLWALVPSTSMKKKEGKVSEVTGTNLKEIEQFNVDATRSSEDLEASTKLVDMLRNEEEFPALPCHKRKEVVQCWLRTGPSRRSEDSSEDLEEASTKLVDTLSNEEEFPALPCTKWKEVVQCGLKTGPCKGSQDPKPTNVWVNENTFAFPPCDNVEFHHSSPSQSSSSVLSNWEDLVDPTPSLHGVNQTAQKQQYGSEQLVNEEERVLHKLENLLADRECFISSSKWCTDNTDVPSPHRNIHEHLLDEPIDLVEKQNGSGAFDLYNVHVEDREKAIASYVNLGNAEMLLQVINKLEERTEQLEKRQVESDREVLQLKSFVRDTQRENQLLKNRLTNLESRFDPSMLLVDDLGRFVEQYLGSEDVIYLIGGFDGSSWLSSLDCFSPSLDILTPLKQMNSTRPFASAVALDDVLYVFGGGSDDSWFNTVECYNRRYDEWMSCPPMIHKKGNLAGTTLNGKIYAIGGSDGVEYLSEVETFDPASGRWIFNQSMIERRFSSAAAELEGVIYAVGGFDGKEHLRSVEKFDPREGYWSALPNMNTRRSSHSLAALSGKLYCMGGYDGQKMISSVEVYDPRWNKWVMGEPMKSVRGYAAAVVIRGSIFAIGGIGDEKNMVNAVERYQEGTGWTSSGWKAIGSRCFCRAIAL